MDSPTFISPPQLGIDFSILFKLWQYDGGDRRGKDQQPGFQPGSGRDLAESPDAVYDALLLVHERVIPAGAIDNGG